MRAAAREHDACAGHLGARVGDDPSNQLKDLTHARFNDASEFEAADAATGWLVGNVVLLGVTRGAWVAGAIREFELFGGEEARLEPNRHVTRDEGTTNWENRRVYDGVLMEDRDVAGLCANVDEHCSKVTFSFGECQLCGGERGWYVVVDGNAGGLHALLEILNSGTARGDEVRACLKSVGDHAAWLLNPLLAVHDVGGWKHMEQHARVRYLDGTADLKDAVNIVIANLAVGVGDCYLAARILTFDVATRDGDGGVLNVIAGEALCSVNGCTNCRPRLLDVGNHSLAHPLVRVGPLTDHADGAVIATDVRDST